MPWAKVGPPRGYGAHCRLPCLDDVQTVRFGNRSKSVARHGGVVSPSGAVGDLTHLGTGQAHGSLLQSTVAVKARTVKVPVAGKHGSARPDPPAARTGPGQNHGGGAQADRRPHVSGHGQRRHSARTQERPQACTEDSLPGSDGERDRSDRRLSRRTACLSGTRAMSPHPSFDRGGGDETSHDRPWTAALARVRPRVNPGSSPAAVRPVWQRWPASARTSFLAASRRVRWLASSRPARLRSSVRAGRQRCCANRRRLPELQRRGR